MPGSVTHILPILIMQQTKTFYMDGQDERVKVSGAKAPFEAAKKYEHPTSNIEHPTSK